MDIEKYGIFREGLSNEIGLLIGNGEMGGLVRNDGLGFDAIWLTDFWSCEAERAPVGPFKLACLDRTEGLSAFNQKLSLKEAVVSSSSIYASGGGYKSQCFFSQSDRHLMVFRLENTSTKAQRWMLTLPNDAELLETNSVRLKCHASASPMELPFTSLAWVVEASLALELVKDNEVSFELEAGQSIELISALVTSFDGPNFIEMASTVASSTATYAALLDNHLRDWAELWKPVDINLPEGLYATTFYRSLYYTFCISGASRFLPGVCQFADPGWGMIPFSNDAGYVVPLLSSINHHGRAVAMLKEFYKPDSLRKNARVYLNILEAMGTQDGYNDAYSFAQMINISGTESNFIFGRQRHLDGFIPAIFHRVSRLNPDDKECAEMTYDVLKGCAIFWLRMLYRDERRDVLMILKTLDLDEKTHAVSVMSAVIACRWTLIMFARYAEERGSDFEIAARCESSLKDLYWPENAERFLSFPDDPEEQITSKYNCIRSFSTLSYPFCELVETYDRGKALRTLDFAHERNDLEKVDSGVNAMTTNMYALTEACFQRADEAFRYASLSLQRLDPSGVAMGEARTDSLFYCSTSYCTFALSTIQMLLQSYDGVIRPFPAVPKEWSNISFSKLPAEGGVLVTAEMCDGKTTKVVYEKKGRVLLEMEDASPVRVRIENEEITLSPII